MLVVSIPAFIFADKWGRRTSTIAGGLGLSSCMLLIGSLYASNSVHSYGIARWVVIVLVFIFGLVYCSTWGIVGKIYASEIQPAHTRAAANCVAQGLGFVSPAALLTLTVGLHHIQLTNWLVAIITPLLLAKSAYGAYFLFGFLALGTVAVLATCMPETRGRSLENIQEAFHRPVMQSWMHHLRRFTSSDSTRTSSESTNGSIELSSILSEGPSGTASGPRALRLDVNAV
jgi:MFS family permease